MDKIPRAEEILYDTLPVRSRKAIKSIIKKVKKRSKTGIWSIKFHIIGADIRPHAIARVLDSRGYKTSVDVGDDGTATITVDWRCM